MARRHGSGVLERRCEAWCMTRVELDAIASLDSVRLSIADQFGRRGLERERRELLGAHVRMLEQPCEPAGDDPSIKLLAALTRAELAPDGSLFTALHTAIRGFPARARLPFRIEAKVGSWIARAANAYPSDARSNGESDDRLDPEAHADRVIRSIESACTRIGADRHLLPTAAYRVAVIAARRGAEQRGAGRFDEARQTAARLFAFANKLLQRDPREAKFHLLLSLALGQEAKNAWRVPDYNLIEEKLRQAVIEARSALQLDPQSVNARWMLRTLQDKLVGVPSKPPTAQRSPDAGESQARVLR